MNRTIVVLGCGHSLNLEDVTYCYGKADVIAVNNAYTLAPWADWHYAADVQWYGVHHEALARDFRGECWTQSLQASEWYGIRHIEGLDRKGLCRDPRAIHLGGNSGYQAVNLAYHLGAHRIILLGFDMCGDHFHGQHEKLANPVALSFAHWKNAFNSLAEDLAWEGVPVYNCSQHTELTCFQRGALRTILDDK